ncbi:hypothetical protein HPULCUR_011573 [Helicostylum pulchrum]|uniref:Uncharacterized protein n=1 Tax=Helicostylum pulchrum TaxID=562976 RepID=A0ABP9YH92_9FUNG
MLLVVDDYLNVEDDMQTIEGIFHFFITTCKKEGQSSDAMFNALILLLVYKWGDSAEKYLENLRHVFEKAKKEMITYNI